MCQLVTVGPVSPSAPTRRDERAQPNNDDSESGIIAIEEEEEEENHVRVCDFHSLTTSRAGLVTKFCEVIKTRNSPQMASINDPSLRPKYQYSQSFRQQSTQDALADVAPSARPSNVNPSMGQESRISKSDIPSKQIESNGSLSLSEENLQHRLNASGSVQAIVVDDDVLFAGLQGGDIVVSRPAGLPILSCI